MVDAPPARPAAGADWWTALGLGVLFAVLPFEPRHPVLNAGALRLTALEALAGILLVALAWRQRARLRALLPRPPLALACLALFALAHMLSAALAPAHADLALKFALRMMVMAFCGFVVVAAWPAGRQGVLPGLASGAVVVAALAIAEGAGWRALDPFLDLFRQMHFSVAGSRRSSAGSEYPNLAAAFLMYGLLAVVWLVGGAPKGARRVLLPAGLFSFALLYTHSRGAIVATAVGLLALAVASRRSPLSLRAGSLATLSVLAASVGAFVGAGETYRLRLGTEGTESWYAVRYETGAGSLVLWPGERRTVRVGLTNVGRKSWVVDEGFHLSYHWYDEAAGSLRDGPRTRLPHDVPPGGRVDLDADVHAPTEAGNYVLVWDMVHERATWFSGQGVRPGVVRVRVVPAGDVSQPSAPAEPIEAFADLSWRPGRLELWRLAWEMWRDRPILGVGPDNFRRLHGPRAGKVPWDSRVYANNLFLETAATTGTLGLLLLLATLGAAAASAWRARARPDRPEAAVLLALLLALSTHGLVDYVLAFTGHYLLFGGVVGASAALGRPSRASGP